MIRYSWQVVERKKISETTQIKAGDLNVILGEMHAKYGEHCKIETSLLNQKMYIEVRKFLPNEN